VGRSGPTSPCTRCSSATGSFCSDGLTDFVDEALVGEIVAVEADRVACCRALVDAALAVGAPDNVSCVVADVQELAPATD
jgi:serine/threonine protein phosphatase PrpC